MCTDCYVVSAAASTPRCRPHWDIRTIETLTPDAQGQAKEWILHVGGSFTDVSTSNAFYRFIETAFHYGVTGGCGTGLFCPSGFMNREQIPNYCPGNPVTREQMGVFISATFGLSLYGP